MRVLSLCSGVGIMDRGLGLVDPHHEVACYVEREAYAAEILARRQRDGLLPVAPIHSDLTTYDGRSLRGRVDGIAAGLPCQPYSVAGRGRGNDDERALWPHFVRLVEECEPAWVFLENTPAFRKHFEPVWEHLRGLGFEWSPPLLHTASESGAPHIRRRFYAFAAHPSRFEVRVEPGRSCGEGRGVPAELGHSGDALAFANRGGQSREWGGWVYDRERETLRHDPDGCDDGCGICGTEWASESPALRVASRNAHWMDELRAAGNAGGPAVTYASAFAELVGLWPQENLG